MIENGCNLDIDFALNRIQTIFTFWSSWTSCFSARTAIRADVLVGVDGVLTLVCLAGDLGFRTGDGLAFAFVLAGDLERPLLRDLDLDLRDGDFDPPRFSVCVDSVDNYYCGGY